MKKKNKHMLKVARTGETHEITSLTTLCRAVEAVKNLNMIFREDVPDDECRKILDTLCQINLDDTGHPFHHKTADGTIVTPDPEISYFLGRIPMDDQEYITNMWQQYIKPDALPAVPVDFDWYKKYPITKEDLDGTSGRFHE